MTPDQTGMHQSSQNNQAQVMRQLGILEDGSKAVQFWGLPAREGFREGRDGRIALKGQGFQAAFGQF